MSDASEVNKVCFEHVKTPCELFDMTFDMLGDDALRGEVQNYMSRDQLCDFVGWIWRMYELRYDPEMDTVEAMDSITYGRGY